MKKRGKPRTRVDVALDARIGILIRQRRLELGLSQAGLAERLGLTFQQVQKYEKAANQLSVARLLQVCDVLRVPVHYFLGSAAPPQRYPASDIRLTRALASVEDGAAKQALLVLVKALSRRP